MTYNPNTTSTDIVDGTIVDIDISSSAAIFSSKISPNYITINGNNVALGESINVSGGGGSSGATTYPLTNGTGINTFSFDGSTSGVTVAIDTTIVPRLASANTFTAAPQTVSIDAASNKGIVIKAASSQSANLQEWQDNNGAIFDQVSSTGALTANAPVTINMYRYFDGTNGVINSPTPTGTGGTFANTGPWSYTVVPIYPAGDSSYSQTRSVTLSATTQTVPLSWSQIPGAIGYKIYRSSGASFTNGTSAYLLNASHSSYTNGTVTSFTDTGATGTQQSSGTPFTSSSAISANIFQVLPRTGSPTSALPLAVGSFGQVSMAVAATVSGTSGSTPNQQTFLIQSSQNVTPLMVKVTGSTQTADLVRIMDLNYNNYVRFDGYGNQISNGANVTVGALPVPSITSATGSTGTGSIPAGTYYYVLTAVNNQGETVASAATSGTTLGSTGNIAVVWNQVQGATSYKLYRNTSSSFPSGNFLVANITASATTSGSLTVTAGGSAGAMNTYSYQDTLATSSLSSGTPPTAPTGTKLITQAWNGQSGNIQEWQNSSGTALASIAPTGTLTVQAASTQDSVKIAGRAGGSNSYGVTLTPATLSASRTLTLPNVDGTAITTGDTGSVTGTMIAGTTITNANISTIAAISPAKLGVASVSITPSTAQTVPNATNTDLGFDTVATTGATGIISGAAGTYSSGTHSGCRITATVACWIEVTGHIAWTNITTGYRMVSIARFLSGGFLPSESMVNQAAAGAPSSSTTVTAIYKMAAGDFLQIRGYQASTAALGYAAYDGSSNFGAQFRAVVLGT